MWRAILMTAVLTGVFCAIFAVAIDWITDMLDRREVIGLSFTSGFLGSLFAQAVLGRWRAQKK